MIIDALVWFKFCRVIKQAGEEYSDARSDCITVYSCWGWMVFAGVVSLVLGGMIFFQWPMSALWVIGLLVAIEMIFHGWAYVMIALALKTAR